MEFQPPKDDHKEDPKDELKFQFQNPTDQSQSQLLGQVKIFQYRVFASTLNPQKKKKSLRCDCSTCCRYAGPPLLCLEPPRIYIEPPRVLVHFVRHADCESQNDKSLLLDPVLTQQGICQADSFRHTFEPMQRITRVIVSPMRRALQTAHLVFHPLQSEGLKLVVWPEVRSMSSSKSSTGSSVSKLESFINGRNIDLSGLERGWEKPSKTNSEERTGTIYKVLFKLWDLGRDEIEKRINPLLTGFPTSLDSYGRRRSQGDNIEFVVVTHGSFLDKLHRHVKGPGTEDGTDNLEWRTYEFATKQMIRDENKSSIPWDLFETEESKTRESSIFEDDFLGYVDRRHTKKLSLHPENDTRLWEKIRLAAPSLNHWWCTAVENKMQALERSVQEIEDAEQLTMSLKAKTADWGVQVAAKSANASMQTRKRKTKDSFVQVGAGAAYSGTVDSSFQVRAITVDFSMRKTKGRTEDPKVQVGDTTIRSQISQVQATKGQPNVQVGATTAEVGTQTTKNNTEDSGVQTGVTTTDAGTQTTYSVQANTKGSVFQERATASDPDVQVGATTTNSYTLTSDSTTVDSGLQPGVTPSGLCM